MKRLISVLMAMLVLLSCLLTGVPLVQVSAKTSESKAIAIVFDNSHSMYKEGNKAWSQATYAMEVFASMLNKGDILLIYPMNRISVNGTDYTMDNPLRIENPEQANIIRDIYTPVNDNGNTHIESVDCAAKGISQIKADKKYVIVLTDGDVFYENNKNLKDKTVPELDERFAKYANAERTVMYLGVGAQVAMPNTPQSEYFFKEKAVNSQDVLAVLTKMCNRIFGRDSLPGNRISGDSINFDISMNKLIVFVQGKNVSDLKVVDANGKQVGKQESAISVKYSENKGNAKHPSEPDTSLQGMMVTYTNCDAGDYIIKYSGTATSKEVYYEPNADLAFVFTDAEGNTVDPDALYEGNYKVSFGMKDAKTGKLSSSDLLGNPKYQGSYYIDGKEYPITYEGFSGSIDIPLKMGEKFKANLTVTYLSGYTISKDSSDFGWPEGGITVAAKPAGELKLEISGGDGSYSLQELEEGSPYIAKVYYQGVQLTGSELESVVLKWAPETSNAEIKKEFADDHWKLSLHYKDPAAPQDTTCGECTVSITAIYSAQGSSKAQTQSPLTYNINDDFSPIQIELDIPNDYIVIKELEESEAITANLKFDGRPLTSEEFAAVNLQVDCGGIAYEVTACEQDSSYLIKLLPTDGIGEGHYPIKVTAEFTDQFGRTTQTDESTAVTLSTMPLWVKWVIGLLILLILFLIIWAILHIKVLPTKAHTTRKLSNHTFDGEDVTKSTNFLTEIKKDGAKMQAQYGGRKFGLLMDAAPGQESYLYKPHKGRSAEVKPLSVRKFGPAKIQEAMIGGAKYTFDEDANKLLPALPNQKPFPIKNGTTVRYSGTISDAGIDKDFEVLSKVSFNKK